VADDLDRDRAAPGPHAGAGRDADALPQRLGNRGAEGPNDADHPGLEDTPRGVYTGAIGYLAPPGSGEPRANFNVAIRTVALDAESGTAEYGVGGGITYDSTASGEYDEVRAKARVLSVRRPSFSLFETLRHDPGTGFRHESGHLARLRDSARYFGFEFDEGSVVGALRESVTGHESPARVRCVLERSGSVSATAEPLPAAGPEPVRIAVDAPSVDPADAMRYHKTTDRRPYDAATARHPDAGDVLLVNLRGEITESTIANVAVRLRGSWWTPPVDAGLLPGIERAAALADGRLRDRTIGVDDLRGAEEISLLNSVRGWWPALLVD
jgi:para-aminobenzoate synthetase / 4-amino-4-deoxychorismate lyase